VAQLPFVPCFMTPKHCWASKEWNEESKALMTEPWEQLYLGVSGIRMRYWVENWLEMVLVIPKEFGDSILWLLSATWWILF
jgi:hypothetical protein